MNPQANLGRILVLSGALTILVDLILTAVIGEPLILIALLVGVLDVAFGLAISGGLLNGRANKASEAEENPYARED